MRPTQRRLEFAAIFSITMLAAYLRFVNLATNPGWYTDEGTHLDIARNLIAGRVQYLAVDQSWLIFSRLPLFENLLALWLRVFGVSMLALRTLTASLGTLTVVLVWALGRRVFERRGLALLAPLLLAIYPPAILYSRFGFSYNLLAPLLMLAALSAGRYAQTQSKRWLAVTAISIGLGTLTDVWAFILLVPFTLVVGLRCWRDLLWSLPLALLPFGLYALTALITAPNAFLFDLRFVMSRLNQLPITQQISTLIQNLTTLSAQDGWFAIGLLGLLALRPAPVRWVMAAFSIVPLVLLGRTTALFSLSAYYMIPLWPFVALGAASLIVTVSDRLTRNTRWRGVIAIGLGGAIGLITVPPLVQQATTHFRTDIEPFLIDPVMAQSAADFVNAHVTDTDLVIASPALAWQIRSNVADFQMPLAYRGQATPHLPADVPTDRWAYEPRYQQARFVIVDNLWRNWAVPDVAGVREMLTNVEQWPSVYRVGDVVVYQNPR
ncbi:MAG: glycosyltransferase family 39 protein [Anaerolineae bacterium]